MATWHVVCVQDVVTAHRPQNIQPLKRHASKPIETTANDSNLVYWRIFRGPRGRINGGAASTATSLSNTVFISLQHANKESSDHSYGNCQERDYQSDSTSHISWNMEFIWMISENSVPTSQKTHIDYKEQQVKHLTPNGHSMGRTAQLTSRCCILYIYSTNIRTEYFKHAA